MGFFSKQRFFASLSYKCYYELKNKKYREIHVQIAKKWNYLTFTGNYAIILRRLSISELQGGFLRHEGKESLRIF